MNYNKEALTEDFIIDLFHVAFRRDEVFELLLEHLKYSYLQHEHEKKFWQKCVNYYKLENKIPSLSVIQIGFRKNEEVREFIAEIKTADTKDYSEIIDQFQIYIKESKFVEIYENAADYYNKGNQEDAFKTFLQGAEFISNFSIKSKVYESVFDNFEERNKKRQNVVSKTKIPFFIDKIDEYTRGGAEPGETVLAMAESGIGKTQWLYHWAISAARFGKKVLIIQIEGTKKQALDRLDAAWTGVLYHEVKTGSIGKENFDPERYKRLQRVVGKIKRTGGEVYVEAMEKFGGISDLGLRSTIREAKKNYGDIDLVLVDYLELMSIGDGVRYGPNDERHRQQKIGRAMKEIAMEEMIVLGTVTQASSLSSELKKNPSFVMTREYLSEDKGKIRPFDFFFTFNQTYDEMKWKDDDDIKRPMLRIYLDKMRDYASGQTVTILMSLKNSRFYDRKNTIKYILEEAA